MSTSWIDQTATNDDILRAARLLKVGAVLSVVGTLLLIITSGFNWLACLAVVITGLLWWTAEALEEDQRWARNAALVFAVLYVFAFPIGTIIGIALLVYLNRALKSRQSSPAGSGPTA